jgi:hypothetical protein
MHRFRVPSIAPGTFFAAQFSAGYTTNMSGFDLRQAHQFQGIRPALSTNSLARSSAPSNAHRTSTT